MCRRHLLLRLPPTASAAAARCPAPPESPPSNPHRRDTALLPGAALPATPLQPYLHAFLVGFPDVIHFMFSKVGSDLTMDATCRKLFSVFRRKVLCLLNQTTK
ncbi:uncharacterized protein LOC124696162 [Lolium rigidum]|uniref:uncharacterized protein LOC124696162 n=1 Tax=Lolium rigidum TaxID=89674 RepID=UPI001F5C30D9|nr:uncharacterized protein LOC124696162 [Lolium rigidum]